MTVSTPPHYEAETLRSAHMYQITPYMDNLLTIYRWTNQTHSCTMMLLHPTLDLPLFGKLHPQGARNRHPHYQAEPVLAGVFMRIC